MENGDPLYIIEVMVHFRYYDKRSRYRLAWSPSYTDRGDIEPTSVFRATTDPCKFHPDQSTYGRTAAEKPVLAYNRGRP